MVDKFSLPETWEELVSLKSSLINNPKNITRSSLRHCIYKLYLLLIPKKLRYLRIIGEIGNNPYILASNKFPYDLILKKLPKVKQFCLWSAVGPLPAQKIDEIIQTTYPQSLFFWFENFPKNKSVPEIWHCHVFVNVQ